MDDLRTGAIDFQGLYGNLKAIFTCIRNSGLKLSMGKCEIGVPEITFLGRTISSEGTSPIKAKIDKFLSNLNMPKNFKQVKRLVGFFQYFRTYLPNLSERLLPFYKLLKCNNSIEITDEHRKSMSELIEMLNNACKITLRQPKTDLQYVILSEASYYSAGYVLMVEDYVLNQEGLEQKLCAPVAFGSKIFNATQVKLSIYAKEFLGVHFAFDNFAHILWGTKKPILVLTDNQSLTIFFQATTISTPLWNEVDHVLNFNFVLGHVPGKANVAVDYLSRIYINPATKLQLKLETRIQLKDVAVEFRPKIPGNSLTALQCYLEEPDSDMIEVFEPSFDFPLNSLAEANPLDEFDLSNNNQSLNLFEEQQKDGNIRTVINWIKRKVKPVTTYSNTELQKYNIQLNRLELYNNVLYHKFFDNTGQNFIRPLVLPKHLRHEILFRIHNRKFMGHIGTAETAKQFRQRFYFPEFTETLLEYVSNCSSCLQIKSVQQNSLKHLFYQLRQNNVFREI